MTYWTIAWGVALGLAGYNIVAAITDVIIGHYNTYKLNRVLDEMDWADWSDYDEPIKATRKKK